MDVETLEKQRFLFLKAVYDEVNRDPRKVPTIGSISQILEMDHIDAIKIAEYLDGEFLITLIGPSRRAISLKHEGRKEVENAFKEPQKPTEHFPANITYIISNSTVTNSNIQQGDGNNSSLQILSKEETPELANIITQLEQVIQFQQLAIEAFEELNSEIVTLKSQNNSPKPKSFIIVEAMKSVRTLLEGISINLISPTLLPAIDHFLKNR